MFFSLIEKFYDMFTTVAAAILVVLFVFIFIAVLVSFFILPKKGLSSLLAVLFGRRFFQCRETDQTLEQSYDRLRDDITYSEGDGQYVHDTYGRVTGGRILLNAQKLEKYGQIPRKNISFIKPLGFKQTKYAFLQDVNNNNPDGYLYQRCHVIAHFLGGCDCRCNLVTGTVAFNQAMKEVEDTVFSIVQNNPEHSFIYTVVTLYEDDDALPYGVTMRLENDYGHVIVNREIMNVQDGVLLYYKTGESEMAL